MFLQLGRPTAIVAVAVASVLLNLVGGVSLAPEGGIERCDACTAVAHDFCHVALQHFAVLSNDSTAVLSVIKAALTAAGHANTALDPAATSPHVLLQEISGGVCNTVRLARYETALTLVDTREAVDGTQLWVACKEFLLNNEKALVDYFVGFPHARMSCPHGIETFCNDYASSCNSFHLEPVGEDVVKKEKILKGTTFLMPLPNARGETGDSGSKPNPVGVTVDVSGKEVPLHGPILSATSLPEGEKPVDNHDLHVRRHGVSLEARLSHAYATHAAEGHTQRSLAALEESEVREQLEREERLRMADRGDSPEDPRDGHHDALLRNAAEAKRQSTSVPPVEAAALSEDVVSESVPLSSPEEGATPSPEVKKDANQTPTEKVEQKDVAKESAADADAKKKTLSEEKKAKEDPAQEGPGTVKSASSKAEVDDSGLIREKVAVRAVPDAKLPPKLSSDVQEKDTKGKKPKSTKRPKNSRAGEKPRGGGPDRPKKRRSPKHRSNDDGEM